MNDNPSHNDPTQNDPSQHEPSQGDLSQFEPLDGTERREPDGELRFGDPDELWQSSPAYDGAGIAPSPRRPELLGDAEAAWWNDVTTWADWSISTFRLTKWFPPCWTRHPALVEEAQALWLAWCDAWLPGIDPGGPVSFLNNLSWSLNRIETLWKIPCSASDHTEPTDPRPSQRHRPVTTEWWSNPDFEVGDPVDWPTH